MSGEGHPPSCPDCAECKECEARAAWCVSESPVNHPCPHLEPICSDCWPGSCVPCRLDAERELFTSGDYTPAADPFYNHLAPAPVDAIARDGGYEWDGHWVAAGPNPKERKA